MKVTLQEQFCRDYGGQRVTSERIFQWYKSAKSGAAPAYRPTMYALIIYPLIERRLMEKITKGLYYVYPWEETEVAFEAKPASQRTVSCRQDDVPFESKVILGSKEEEQLEEARAKGPKAFVKWYKENIWLDKEEFYKRGFGALSEEQLSELGMLGMNTFTQFCLSIDCPDSLHEAFNQLSEVELIELGLGEEKEEEEEEEEE